jgi:very-short-patch-repair endonuclease
VSRGAKELLRIVRKIFPNQRIITEHDVGERLRLDIYLPSLRIAFEYDGRQHLQYVEHFHGDLQGFANAKKRDARKVELCEKQGITLISIACNKSMTEEYVRQKITEALE